MSEFKLGQIVYASSNNADWCVTHYAGVSDGNIKSFRLTDCYLDALVCTDVHTASYVLSVEDYHKMAHMPKHKDLCECWDSNDTHSRVFAFYDADNKGVFDYEGSRLVDYPFENYKVIPRDQWPEWAVEAYKTLGG